MFTLKLVAAALTAAGIVATAAGIAPQSGATTRTNETRTAEPVSSNPKTPPRSDSTDAITVLARARYDAARKIFERVQSNYASGKTAITWLRSSALRVLEAQRDLNTTKSNEIAALEAYLGEMKKAEALEKSEHDPDFIAEAEYDRLEAELWLARRRPERTTHSPAQAAATGQARTRGPRPFSPGSKSRSRCISPTRRRSRMS